MGSYVAVSTIIDNWREHPPSSYSLKIQNLSQLENSTIASNHKYQSRHFPSGGYNWRLIIYTKGNEKDNGSGFISMYVEIDSTSFNSKSAATEVFVELRFFVFNKKENKYLTTQDVEVKRFNALKTVWGLPHVLPLDTFNNPENGYLFEGDQCEFGVDVIVSQPLTNWEILSFEAKLPYPKFFWTIKNFSKKEMCYTSDSFPMGGRNWCLELCLKGDYHTADGIWSSIFLSLADSETVMVDEEVYAEAHLRVLDPCGFNHLIVKFMNWHNKENLGWGQDQFVLISKLQEDYLDKNGSLNVEIEFEVVSATEYSPTI